MKKETSIWHDDASTPGSDSPQTGVRPRLTKRRARWLDHFFSMELPQGPETKLFAPPYEISETASHFHMALDLPGISRHDVHVEIVGNELQISGERQPRLTTAEKGLFPSREKPRYGKFRRSFTLPVVVDLQGIEARFGNGVLTVSLPKQGSPQVRSVPVEAELEPSPPSPLTRPREEREGARESA